MSSSERRRLDALERALVGAAANQAQRRGTRRRRALVALALGVPLALAAAGSMAATGLWGNLGRQVSTLRDGALGAPPADVSGLAHALGTRPSDVGSARTWTIAGQRLVGYTTASGSFCFRFGSGSGGCLHPRALSRRRPIDMATDYGPNRFRIYGLAMNGVTAVSLEARGITRRAQLASNAFYLEADSLGGTGPVRGTLVVRLGKRATMRMPLHVHSLKWNPANALPQMPGALLPAEDTAA